MDKRGRVKPEDAKPGLSKIKQILMENIVGADNGPRGSYFLGIPESKVEDIVFKNIRLEQKASQKSVIQLTDVQLMYGAYPDAHMIDHIGDAPAYSLWARDVQSLTFIDYEVIPETREMRPKYIVPQQ